MVRISKDVFNRLGPATLVHIVSNGATRIKGSCLGGHISEGQEVVLPSKVVSDKNLDRQISYVANYPTDTWSTVPMQQVEHKKHSEVENSSKAY